MISVRVAADAALSARSCASTTFDFDLPEELIALRPASPRDARGCWRSIRRPTPPIATARCSICLSCSSRRRARVQRHQGDAGRARGHSRARRLDAQCLSSSSSARRSSVAGSRAPAKRLKPGDRMIFGEGGHACLLGSLATVDARGDDGEVTLAFDLSARRSTKRSERTAPCRCRLISPRAARPTSATASTIRRSSRWRRARSPRRPPASFHRPAAAGAGARGVGATCVTLHVGAGTFLPVRAADTEDHVMHKERVPSRPSPPCAECREGEGRQHRRGRHHLVPLARNCDGR